MVLNKEIGTVRKETNEGCDKSGLYQPINGIESNLDISQDSIGVKY